MNTFESDVLVESIDNDSILLSEYLDHFSDFSPIVPNSHLDNISPEDPPVGNGGLKRSIRVFNGQVMCPLSFVEGRGDRINQPAEHNYIL